MAAPDLPRTQDGDVDFAVLWEGITMEDLVRDGAVPLWVVATRPTSKESDAEDPTARPAPD